MLMYMYVYMYIIHNSHMLSKGTCTFQHVNVLMYVNTRYMYIVYQMSPLGTGYRMHIHVYTCTCTYTCICNVSRELQLNNSKNLGGANIYN